MTRNKQTFFDNYVKNSSKIKLRIPCEHFQVKFLKVCLKKIIFNYFDGFCWTPQPLPDLSFIELVSRHSDFGARKANFKLQFIFSLSVVFWFWNNFLVTFFEDFRFNKLVFFKQKCKIIKCNLFSWLFLVIVFVLKSSKSLLSFINQF